MSRHLPPQAKRSPAHDQGVWTLPLIGFGLYAILFVAGSWASLRLLNVAGAAALLALAMLARCCQSAWERLGHSGGRAVLCLVAVGFAATLNPDRTSLGDLAKFSFPYIFFLLLHSLRLPPAQRKPTQLWFLAQVGGLLLLSLASVFMRPTTARASGLFTNPNNLALAAQALLFLADHRRTLQCLALHAVALGILVVSGTSGALLSYVLAAGAAGILLFLRRARARKAAAGAWLACATALVAICLVPLFAQTPAVQRTWQQLEAVQRHALDAWNGPQPDYAEMADRYGSDSLSGIWRVFHWAELLKKFADSDWWRMLFGNGPGASRVLLPNVPHNEYLRLLLEQGLFGLAATLSFYGGLWRRLSPQMRLGLATFALYSASENNLENLLFMSWLMAFLASQGSNPRRHRYPRPILPIPVTKPARHPEAQPVLQATILIPLRLKSIRTPNRIR